MNNELKQGNLGDQVEAIVRRLICCYSCCNGVNTRSLTTIERDALSLSATERRIIYNDTTAQFEGWTGVAWVALS